MCLPGQIGPFLLLLVAAVGGQTVAGVRRTDVTRNPETGGLENILVALDPALDGGQCRLILATLKVTQQAE